MATQRLNPIARSTQMNSLSEGFSVPLVVQYYVLTLFGSSVMQIFSLYKDFNGADAFLRKVIPKRSDVFYTWTNFLLVVFIGSVIGTVFFHPTTPVQA